jgi:sugar O-acyltransferase (sialic acid O-acetyltransferase NeuD family)
VVFGAGGHAAEIRGYVLELIRRGWDGELLGFLDDGLEPGVHKNLQVLGPINALVGRGPEVLDGLFYLTAFGSNALRRKVVERIETLYAGRIAPWTLIHPAASIGEDVAIGEGACIAPGATITSRVEIGQHVILNIKASVSHDCLVGDFVNLNPGVTVCGKVKIGDGANIGAGATLIDGVSVGRNAIIGAGAVVIHDIPADVTAVGVPARLVKRND